MKKLFGGVLCVAMLLTVCLSFTACKDNSDAEANLWDSAMYTEDTELGSGDKTLYVTVEADDRSVEFTIHTDKATVGEALVEHGLIDGEKSQYGMYVKVVNGITADYDIDQTYWAFRKDGQDMITGVDLTEFEDGDRYELVRAK